MDEFIEYKSLPESVGVKSLLNFLLCESDAVKTSQAPSLPICEELGHVM